MLKKLSILLGVAVFFISSASIADTCMQKFQGLNFTAALVTPDIATTIVYCDYDSLHYVPSLNNVKPVSGPWKSLGINTWLCRSSQASQCVFKGSGAKKSKSTSLKNLS